MASGSSFDRDRCKHTDVETEEVCVCTKWDSTKSEDKLLCGRCGHHASFHVPGDAIKSRPGRCSETSGSVCEDGCQEFFPSRDSRLPKNCGGCGCHRYDHLTEGEGVLPRSFDAEIVELESGPAGDRSNAVDSTGRDDALDSRHKIFLSFSGAQRRFAKKVHGELVKCDRYPFYDHHRSCLPLGEDAQNRIWEAIKTCRIGVVILSEDYFTRTIWPMLEFVRMARELKRNETPIKIIPVFLGISPDDCCDRKKHEQWKKIWEEWASLEKNKQYNIDVAEWVQSVQEFFDQPIQRLELRSEGQKRDLRKEIVDAICKEVRPESTFALPNVQGHARLYEDFRKMIFLDAERENANLKVHVVGLYGAGGVGKTILCKVLRYKLSTEFRDKVCHVELGKLSKIQVYRKVIQEFVELEPQVLDNLKDVTDTSVFLHHLNSSKLEKKVFLAIDNVTDEHEMMDLSSTLKNVKWCNGSVVLITARSQDVLIRLGIDQSQCFKMLDLMSGEAEALFLNSVRCVDPNVNVDEALIGLCLDRCYFYKGDTNHEQHWHPLALDVLGKQLMFSFGYNPDCWKRQLKKIDTFNSTRSVSEKHPIFSILRTSFEALRDEEKLLFMDATLFNRYEDSQSMQYFRINPFESDDKSDDGVGSKPPCEDGFRVVRPTRADDVVSEFKWLCMVHDKEDDELKDMLDSLKRKSVLETVNDEVIGMHDLWREFAIEETTLGDITERRWVKEDLTVKGLSKGDNVRSMELGVPKAVNLRTMDLTGFSKLSVLTVFGLRSNMTLNVHKLDLLKSLQVTTEGFDNKGFDITGLGTLESLVFLRIWYMSYSTCLEEIKDLANLQILDLDGFSGDKLPDFRGLTNLRVLNIRLSMNLKSVDLDNLPKLTDLDVDFGKFKKLKICRCTSLRNVWGLGQNENLRELRISSCSRLEELPGLQKCKGLTVLNIFECPRIESVPDLMCLKKLKEVVINGRTLTKVLQKKTLKRTRVRKYLEILGQKLICYTTRKRKRPYGPRSLTVVFGPK